ncbi:unnamed protein product [Calypogeia fissa]
MTKKCLDKQICWGSFRDVSGSLIATKAPQWKVDLEKTPLLLQQYLGLLLIRLIKLPTRSLQNNIKTD